MKNFIYAANIRLPTEKAHGVQIVNTCSELAEICKDKNINFELIISDRGQGDSQEIFANYKISENKKFKIVKLKTINLFKPFFISFWLQQLQFAFKLQIYLLWNYKFNCFVYSRDWFILFSLMFKAKKLFWEVHEDKLNVFSKILLKKANGVIAISNGLKELFNPYFKNILVAADAVNIDEFNLQIDKNICKENLKLNQNIKYITYIGSIGLYGWKGVDTFLQASKFLQNEKDLMFLLVGGSEANIAILKQKYKNKNILFVGRQKFESIPVWQKAAEILIIPNEKGNLLSEKYTSPMKLFEYMASNTPIVASDLPSLREVLNDGNATFFQASNAIDLSEKIKYVLENYDSSKEKAKQALKDVEEFTYIKRAKKIFDFVYEKNN